MLGVWASCKSSFEGSFKHVEIRNRDLGLVECRGLRPVNPKPDTKNFSLRRHNSESDRPVEDKQTLKTGPKYSEA